MLRADLPKKSIKFEASLKLKSKTLFMNRAELLEDSELQL